MTNWSMRRVPTPYPQKGVTAGVLSDVKMYTKMEQLEHLRGGGGVEWGGVGGWINDYCFIIHPGDSVNRTDSAGHLQQVAG